jgi:cell division protein FtsQ
MFRLKVGFRLVLCAAALIGSVALLRYTHRMLQEGDYFGIREIRYEGVRNFDSDAFTRLLQSGFEQNLFTLNLERVRDLLESEKWVREATVRRQFPDRLILQIVERQPVAVAAIEGDLYVVDSDGVVLTLFQPRFDNLDRPIVKGLLNVALEDAESGNAFRMKTYLQVFADLGSNGRNLADTVSEIDVGNPSRVILYPVDDPVPIYLGETDFRKRYERFLNQRELYNELKEKYGPIEYVDVSFENKIIFHTPDDSVSG